MTDTLGLVLYGGRSKSKGSSDNQNILSLLTAVNGYEGQGGQL